jgi:hypothetical protein
VPVPPVSDSICTSPRPRKVPTPATNDPESASSRSVAAFTEKPPEARSGTVVRVPPQLRCCVSVQVKRPRSRLSVPATTCTVHPPSAGAAAGMVLPATRRSE